MNTFKKSEDIEAEREAFYQDINTLERGTEQEKAVTVRLPYGLVAQLDALSEFFDVSRQLLLSKFIKLEVDMLISTFNDEILHKELLPLISREIDQYRGGVK